MKHVSVVISDETRQCSDQCWWASWLVCCVKNLNVANVAKNFRHHNCDEYQTLPDGTSY